MSGPEEKYVKNEYYIKSMVTKKATIRQAHVQKATEIVQMVCLCC